MPLHVKAWQQTARHHGLRVSAHEVYVWEGEPGMVTAARLLRREGRHIAGNARPLLREKEARFSRLARGVRPDARLIACLRRLRGGGARVALVTGTSSRELRRMLRASERSLFDATVTGDRVRHGKPHPEPYRLAMRVLGVPRRLTMVVENAPNGIRSARRAQAGYVVALASSLPPRYLRQADRVARTIPALCRVLDRLAGGIDKRRRGS